MKPTILMAICSMVITASAWAQRNQGSTDASWITDKSKRMAAFAATNTRPQARVTAPAATNNDQYAWITDKSKRAGFMKSVAKGKVATINPAGSKLSSSAAPAKEPGKKPVAGFTLSPEAQRQLNMQPEEKGAAPAPGGSKATSATPAAPAKTITPAKGKAAATSKQ